ncbi:MAG: chemotaxis protein CheD [Rhodospirillaceae bacterium]
MSRHRHQGSPLPVRTLLPGDVYCERSPEILATVLGSCVSVCLWEPRLRFGGMNHFVLPYRPSNAEPSFRFGDVAVTELIARMLSLGGDIRQIQAKLFGGAYVLRAGNPEYAVGRRNIEIAVSELRRYKIPVVASRLSGIQGLVVRHCTDCGKVWVRPVGTMVQTSERPSQLHELSCVSEDIVTAMITCDQDGLPVTIRTRQTPAGTADCQICSDSPTGGRQT